MLAPAIALCIGIAFSNFFTMPWWVHAIFALAVGPLALQHRRWPGLTMLAFIGAAIFSFRMEPRAANDLRHIARSEPELVRIRGTIAIEPERRVLEQDGKVRHRTTARIRVESIEQNKEWRAASGAIAVSTMGFLPEQFVSGARIEIFGVLSAPQGALAPGLFDFERYLKHQRTFFVLRAETAEDWTLLAPASKWTLAAFCRWFNDWGRRTLQRSLPEDQHTRLLWSMALGWRAGLSNEISEPFMRTGTLHVFAISGLHIAMMAWILVKFLTGAWIPTWIDNRCPWLLRGLPRPWTGAIVLPIIWFYTAATGWQASAIRSTIMSSVIIIGWAARRPSNLLNSLAVSALIILLWQPEQLFQAGFQLSFILLLSMAVWPGLIGSVPWPDPTMILGQKSPTPFEQSATITPWGKMLAIAYEKLTGRDELLPPHLRAWWQKQLDSPVAWFLGGVNLSLASLVGAGMVTAHYFNLISFTSIFANLVIVPLSGIALGTSMASLALGFLPFLPEFFNWASWSAMWLMVRICEALEAVPFSYTYVASPGAFTIAVYYACAIGLVTGWGLRTKKRTAAFSSAAVVALALSIYREASTTTVTMLPGGGAIFINAPANQSDLLVDCDRDRGAAIVVKPFLRSQGVDRVSHLVLTHGDVEHVGGFWRIQNDFAPRAIYTSPARSRSPEYRRILESLEGRRHELATASSVAGWEVLHPRAHEDFGRADDDAIVLAREIGGARVILLSDLGRAGQRQLIEHNSNLRCDILFCGASNDGAMREEFIEALSPKIVVIAGGLEGPSKNLLEQWRRQRVQIFATGPDRAAQLVSRSGKLWLEIRNGERFLLP